MSANPYKDQVTRMKKAVQQIESAQEYIARAGLTYQEHNNPDHEEYMKALYSSLEVIKQNIIAFRTNM